MKTLRPSTLVLFRGGFAGFTLIELMVVVAILGILSAILLPALGKAKARAKGAQCLSTQRQIGIAMHLYADADSQGYLPLDPRATNSPPWIDALAPHSGDVDALRTCPSDPLGRQRQLWKRTGYVLNQYTSSVTEPAELQSFDGAASSLAPSKVADPGGREFLLHPASPKLSSYRRPSETFLVFEGSNIGTRLPDGGESPTTRPIYDDHTHPDTWGLGWPHVLADIDPYRHGQSATSLFADGHASLIPAFILKRRIENGDNFAVIPE